jgi:hypothetical protein
LVLISACKQLQENQAVAWILKTKEKNPAKQESLVFLETTVHRVGETAENQRKTREKSKVAEKQVFWLDFCAKKRTVHTLSGFLAYWSAGFGGFLQVSALASHCLEDFFRLYANAGGKRPIQRLPLLVQRVHAQTSFY